MKYLQRLSFFSLLLVFCTTGNAQETGALYMLPSVSQSSFLNPAVQNKTDKLVIGIPFLSGSHLSWNSSFPLDALFSHGLWNYSFVDFYDNLSPVGEGQTSLRISIFYASLKMNKSTFSVSLAERAFGTTTFDREVVRLIRDGVQPYLGRDEYFGSGTANFNHYRELAFGISNRYWKELDIGIRPKILFGRTYFDAQDVDFSVETVTNENDDQLLYLQPEGSFALAAPLEYTRDSVYDFVVFSNNAKPADYSFNLRNIGAAVDVGVAFRPNKFYEVSASVLDFGFTGYRHNTYDVEFVDPIEFPEYNLYQSIVPGGEDYVEPREALRSFSDSVSYIINVTDQKVRIVNLLPFRVNLEGKYNFSETLSAGLNNQFAYYGRHSMNILSGFALKQFSRTEVSTSLSLYNLSDFWLGLAAGYTAEHVQYYIATKNILGIIQPASSKHLNLSFGINFLFNTGRR